MKRVSYAGGSFLTADRAADALVEFTAALSPHHRAEIVELPTVDDQGRSRFVRLVVGPVSQLITVSEECAFDEPDTADVVSDLRSRTRAANPPSVGLTAHTHVAPEFDIDEIDSR